MEGFAFPKYREEQGRGFFFDMGEHTYRFVKYRVYIATKDEYSCTTITWIYEYTFPRDAERAVIVDAISEGKDTKFETDRHRCIGIVCVRMIIRHHR